MAEISTSRFEPLWMTNFEILPGASYIDKSWPLSILISCLYLTGIHFGDKIMANRSALHLTGLLICWNMFLCMFSLLGTIYIVPQLMTIIAEHGWEGSMTLVPEETWGNKASGFWVQAFIISKLFELFDTAFLVLRKRPVIFLHWFHHITVLLYCWHSNVVRAPQTIYFVAMNYAVHAVMYGYFALATMKRVPRWFPPSLITAAQISQMFVGIGIQLTAMYLYPKHSDKLDLINIILGTVMYTVYFGLFAAFALSRFVIGKRKRT